MAKKDYLDTEQKESSSGKQDPKDIHRKRREFSKKLSNKQNRLDPKDAHLERKSTKYNKLGDLD